MASITLKNVYKIYPHWKNPGEELIAVQDFNLDIKDGEVIVLVGPSGCGKSTMLHLIAGLEDITKGELYIDGKPMDNVDPKDRGLAMVFQNYAIFPHMTIYENIAFGLKPLEMPEAEIKEKIAEIARYYDITHLLERKYHQLSSGQNQRVALARATVREHKIMLLDEPLANLDAKLRNWMRIELMKMHQKFKMTYIYVTHNQEEAMAIADRLVLMKDGMIQQVGTPEELYKHPRNLFAAGFLGSPQMNFIDTKIFEQDGNLFINYGESKIKLPEAVADKAAAYIGKEIIAGIRPEDLHADEASIKKFGDYIINADVGVREYIGDMAYLYCDCKYAWQLVIRVSPDCTAKSGDKIKIAVNPEKIYLFDKDTELAIN